jgi:glycine/D-amino acid oxidase-like deaminating enzyme
MTDKFPEPAPSLWQETYGPYTANAPVQGEIEADIAIIGGGFSGVATAHELKRAEPSLRVVLLEAQAIGYGASGRNGSFAMTVQGLGFGVTAMLRGRQFLRESHRYMMRAVDYTDELIAREKLDCDRIRPGFLRVATTEGYIKRLHHDIELMHGLGFDDIHWIDAEDLRARIDSPRYLGAMWEPRLVLINPLKLVRAEKALAERLGAAIYENSPVLEISSRPRFRLTTPQGAVAAEKLVFAANAYSHLFPQLRFRQIPAFTYMIATEPLSPAQLDPIGWQGREGVEDARNLIHYYRVTPDNRLIMGGGPVGLTYANSLYKDDNQAAWEHLEEHLRWLFPSLEDARIAYRWGGPFSVTADLSPALGFLGDRRAVYSLGCIGHGVSMSHLNAQAIRDMLLERQSDLLDCPFINRRVIPWPPEPLRIGVAGLLRGYLALEDRVYERGLS